MLASLASFYWRPDFGPAQSAAMTANFVEDLIEFPVAEIEVAIAGYRRDGKNKFFPTPGALREIILEARKDRAQDAKVSAKPMPAEVRPVMWWTKPPYLWALNWRESEIPIEHVAMFQRRLDAKRAAAAEGWGEDDFGGLARKQRA